MKPVTLELQIDKETINTIRFKPAGWERERSGDRVMPNAYVNKAALVNAFGRYPQRIRITIEAI